MKGMSCGARVYGLVALTALVSAFAPALARADVTGGQLPSVSVTPPAVPAVPSPTVASAPAVPAPAAPAAPAPVAAAANAAAAKAVKVESTVGATVTADPAHGALTIHVPMTQASVSKSGGSVGVDASKIVKPVNDKVNGQIAKVTGNKHVKKATTAAAKKASTVVKKASRVIAWDSGSDPGDPMKGCKDGVYTTCTVVPLTAVSPYTIDNRCWDFTGPNSSTFSMPDDGGDSTGTPPPFGPDPVNFSQGTEVIWIHTQPDTVGSTTGMRIHMKTFVWGLLGVGTTDGGAVYKLGHDFQDEFDTFVPFGLGMSVKKLTQDLLLVDNHSATPAPNMVYTEHMSLSADGSVAIQWHIVCHTGQTGDGKPDKDHDRSGDMNQYKHNHGDFNGYNDDPPSSWDQND